MSVSFPTAATPVKKRPLRSEEFTHLAESGYFGDCDRLELIEGDIIVMSPIGDAHGAVVRWLTHLLTDPGIRNRANVSIQSSIVLSEHTQPQPDICLIKADALKRVNHPGPDDILLLVEVSESTLVLDRDVKSRLYAKAGIPEYWIVNLKDNLLEVLRDPDTGAGRYRTCSIHAKGDTIAPIYFPDFAIAVSEVLP